MRTDKLHSRLYSAISLFSAEPAILGQVTCNFARFYLQCSFLHESPVLDTMAEGPGPSGTQRRASGEGIETSPDAVDFRRNMRQQYRDLTQIVQGVPSYFRYGNW